MKRNLLKDEKRMLIKNGIYLNKTIKNIVVADSEYYFNKNNKINLKETVNKAYKSIEETFNNKERIAIIESNKRYVKCNSEGIKHGIIKVKDNENYRSNSFIISNVGMVIKNALKINETKPTVKYPKGQDIYLSIISDTQANSYPCRIIVNRDNSILNEIEYIDQLKAVKGIKKERVPYGIPTLEVGDVLSINSIRQANKKFKAIKKERIPCGIPTLEVGDTLSIYTLEQLAKEVKNKYSDCLPSLLLRKFNIKREKTRLSENILF